MNQSKLSASEIKCKLDILFPTTRCFLNYEKDYQLLIAIALSAQTTDEKVNSVTNVLNSIYDTQEKLAKANIEDIKNIIKPVGLINNKSKAVLDIAAKYNKKDFHSLESLTSLTGVGNKTAKVFLAEFYEMEYFPVDTHILRVSNRLGLFDGMDATKCSSALEDFFASFHLINLHRQFILLGRNYCLARKPKCNLCPFSSNCHYLINK